ncbi:hypothetical protein FACS1894186_2020 [Alphaproteobacteria bacterium]|nr:hypothetical protein FACS1894186_2020 [Alphaproteobacteria bacterium]
MAVALAGSLFINGAQSRLVDRAVELTRLQDAELDAKDKLADDYQNLRMAAEIRDSLARDAMRYQHEALVAPADKQVRIMGDFLQDIVDLASPSGASFASGVAALLEEPGSRWEIAAGYPRSVESVLASALAFRQFRLATAPDSGDAAAEAPPYDLNVLRDCQPEASAKFHAAISELARKMRIEPKPPTTETALPSPKIDLMGDFRSRI